MCNCKEQKIRPTYNTETQTLDLAGMEIDVVGNPFKSWIAFDGDGNPIPVTIINGNPILPTIINGVFIGQEPKYERVPEGVFRRETYGRIIYPFGNRQFLAWNINGSYCVCDNSCHVSDPIQPYLIPTTFSELKLGEWFKRKLNYCLKIGLNKYATVSFDGGVTVSFLNENEWDEEVFRLSEVMP